MIEKKFDCLGIGRSCLDYLALVKKHPRKNSKVRADEFLVEGGGQVATALVTLSRLGARCKYIGIIGEDKTGNLMLSKLLKEGIDVSDVEKSKKINSPQALIIVEKSSGQRTIVYEQQNKPLSKKISSSIIQNSKSILIDPQETIVGIEVAKIARRKNIPVIYDAERNDPVVKDMVALSSHLICNEEFPTLFTNEIKLKDALHKVVELGPEVVVATLGEKGSLGVNKGGAFQKVKGYKDINVIDTTGSGDAFHGAFIFGLLKKWDLFKTMAFANVVAGMSCRSLGGRKGLPDLHEALKALKSYYKIID